MLTGIVLQNKVFLRIMRNHYYTLVALCPERLVVWTTAVGFWRLQYNRSYGWLVMYCTSLCK